MAYTLDTIIVAKREHVSTDLADEIVILNTSTGTYFGLNAVGALVWKLVQDPITIREVCAQVEAEYEVEAAQCEIDMLKLCEELGTQGLIEAA